jgi:predicted GIY-YIG superfamily endonuclease/proteasome lid subunit RPN8/RPN11
MPFWAYMRHCRGGPFYAGHTDDLERRIAQHQTGFFRGFTSRYLPAELVWSQEFDTRDEAKAAERRIKGWPRRKKLALIRGDWAEISRLSKNKDGPSTSSGRTDLRVGRNVVTFLRAEADRAMPEECCGLLLGHETIEHAQPAANVAKDRRRHFEIDPQALVDAHRAARAGGPGVMGYYHSHPLGPAAPSATDRALAPGDGRIWAIVGQDGVTFWRDDQHGFAPLPYVVEDR